MALKRETSVAVGLATMGLVGLVYSQVTPRIIDMRVSKSDEPNAAAAEKTARWTSGAMVVGISLITRDATVFIMGGLAVVSLSWMTRHANHHTPAATGKFMPTAPQGSPMSDGVAAGYTIKL